MDREDQLRFAATELVVTSFIVLFQELTLIRWLSAEVRVLAYFPNIVLIGAFLGLGIGTMRAGRRSLFWLWPASLVILVFTTIGLHEIAFTNREASEYLWLLYVDLANPRVVHDVRPPMVILFILSAISFIPLAQIVGARLQDFAKAGNALRGYVFDLLGSLIGVIAFAAASFFRTFPVFWFSVILAAGLVLLLRRERWLLGLYAVCAIAALSPLLRTERAAVYSPYYAIRARHMGEGDGIQVLANGSFHQYAAPLSRSDRTRTGLDRALQASYPVPYASLGRKPRNVLVLGAGSGNDVAVALDAGADHVDAVEIDPVIAEMGHSLHPDRPYRSPKVRVINTDARAFLRNTTERYDVIIFGTLDSMTKLSALANVRLDNFVYTVDCMRAVRTRLTPDGAVALYFMVKSDAIHEKLFAMLTQAFGEPPLVLGGFKGLFSDIFLAGPGWQHLQTPARQSLASAELAASKDADVPTDDWPYLYLTHRGVSAFYISVSAMLLAIAAAMIALCAPEMRKRATSHFDAEMFLFGLAFLLLETKLVTEMSLVWGATWITSAVVFGSILVMILIGTIAMQRRPVSFAWAMAGLICALLATYLVPTTTLLAQSVAVRLVLSVLFAGVPVLFASICFALRFRERTNANLAFGWNMAGAVIGGLTELLSMAIGIRALTLVALVVYLGVFLIERRRSKTLLVFTTV
jgi:hypothetical protein